MEVLPAPSHDRYRATFGLHQQQVADHRRPRCVLTLKSDPARLGSGVRLRLGLGSFEHVEFPAPRVTDRGRYPGQRLSAC